MLLFFKFYLCGKGVTVTFATQDLKNTCLQTFKFTKREVAQAGSAPGLGPGGRRFESCLPDLRGQIGIIPILSFFILSPTGYYRPSSWQHNLLFDFSIKNYMYKTNNYCTRKRGNFFTQQLCTTGLMPHTIKEAYELSVQGFFIKPYSYTKLRKLAQFVIND